MHVQIKSDQIPYQIQALIIKQTSKLNATKIIAKFKVGTCLHLRMQLVKQEGDALIY